MRRRDVEEQGGRDATFLPAFPSFSTRLLFQAEVGRNEAALTSGGMAILHMATPAEPPARMMAPRSSFEGSDPSGVRAFLMTS